MHPLFDERRYLIPFRGTLLPQIFCETLVIGTGVGGLRAAIAAAEHGDVIVLAKAEVGRSSTALAQGGVAAVLEPTESELAAHEQDTLAAGMGLCRASTVRTMVRSAAARIAELQQWGMRFDLDESKHPAMGLEGGHHRARILHTDGDATGRELVRCLGRRVLETPGIRVFEQCFALDLLTAGEGGEEPRVVGAITHHPKYGLQMIWSWATILATGGAGQVYRETTNPTVTTGDGLAMAYRAGARIGDMAFVQFHPTTLYVAGGERTLITEAVRGEGAVLVDRRGDRIMQGLHDMADLAPRDVVSRCILEHVARTGDTHVFLDARRLGKGFFAKRFPGIHAQLARFGIDPARDPIPVHPSAHYTIGGVWTDESARTNLPSLYACGEAACSGLHGANRLASNSLLEGLVFGEIAGRLCAECREESDGEDGSRPSKRIISDIPPATRGELDLTDVRSSLRSVMWRHVGIVRDGAKMVDVRDMIDFWARYMLDKVFDEPAGWETQNMLLVASLITESAIWRQESRGTHLRLDFPAMSQEYRRHDLRRKGMAEPETEPAEGAEVGVGATT